MIYCNYKDLLSKKIVSEKYCYELINFIEKNINDFQAGRFDIVDGIYANVCQYETSEWKNLFEGHKNYIDVQCVIEGKEYIQVSNKKDSKVDKEYDPAKDVVFYQSKNIPKNIELSCKNLVVLYPEDLISSGQILFFRAIIKSIS